MEGKKVKEGRKEGRKQSDICYSMNKNLRQCAK